MPSAVDFAFEHILNPKLIGSPDIVRIGESFNVIVGQVGQGLDVAGRQLLLPQLGIERRTAMVGPAILRVELNISMPCRMR